MRHNAAIITGLLIVLALTGCSKSADTKSTASGTAKNTTTAANATTDEGTPASDSIVDRYLYANSYDELTTPDSDTNDVKLREPLKPTYGTIPPTPPDSAFGTKPIVAGQNTPGVGPDIDKNLVASKLPEPLMFLYNMRSYVKNDLINNGYIMVYSTKTDNAEVESYLRRLRVANEVLDEKDYQIRELFKGDADLVSAWDNCYKQLTIARNTLSQIKDGKSLLKYNKDFDIPSLNKVYNDFESSTQQQLAGFVPYVGDPPTKTSTTSEQANVDTLNTAAESNKK